jgi:hypothetical protein
MIRTGTYQSFYDDRQISKVIKMVQSRLYCLLDFMVKAIC